MVLDFIKEIFFPSDVKCLICSNEQTEKYSLCADCLDEIKKPEGQRCNICFDRINTEGLCAACFNKKPFYTKLYCSYIYAPPLKDLILKFKSGSNEYLKEYFARIALDTVPKEVFDKCTLITNAPCSKEKLLHRGYDQGAAIGKAVSKKTGIPYKETIVRLKEEKTALLNKASRLKSADDRYLFCENVYNETILLVDDVCTTGATLRACADQLKKAGAKEVFCFTVARTDKT